MVSRDTHSPYDPSIQTSFQKGRLHVTIATFAEVGWRLAPKCKDLGFISDKGGPIVNFVENR